jgi:hypothetical protein
VKDDRMVSLGHLGSNVVLVRKAKDDVVELSCSVCFPIPRPLGTSRKVALCNVGLVCPLVTESIPIPTGVPGPG